MQHISSILSAWVTTTPYDQIAECLLHISMQLQAMPKAKRYQEVIAMCKDDALRFFH